MLDGNRLAGTLSKDDVLVRVVAAGRDPGSTTVGEVGMEQPDNLAGVRVDPRDVRTFEIVAVKTGEREIVGGRFAAVRLGNDVVKLKRRAHKCFGQQAILATEKGPATDELLPRRQTAA